MARNLTADFHQKVPPPGTAISGVSDIWSSERIETFVATYTNRRYANTVLI